MTVIIPKPGGSYNFTGPVPGSDDKLYVLNALGVWVLMSEQDTSLNSSETEADKLAAEAAKLAAETAETNAELAETNAETAETNAETAETNAETAETNAETAETNAETAQGLAETAKTGAETAQGLAETAQGLAETAKTGAETAQGLAETAQGLAETAKTGAETAQGLAETAQGLAETAKTGAETAQGLAETAQLGAEAAASAAVAEVIATAGNQMELRTAEITAVTEVEEEPAGAKLTFLTNTAEAGTYSTALTLEGGEIGEPVNFGNVSWNSNNTPAELAALCHNKIEETVGYSATVIGDSVIVSNAVLNETLVGTELKFTASGVTTSHVHWVTEATPGSLTIEIDNATNDQQEWDWEKKVCISGYDFEMTEAVATIANNKITLVVSTENVTGAYTPQTGDDISPAYYDYSFTHNLNTAYVNLFVFAQSTPTTAKRNTALEQEIYDKVLMPDVNAISATLTNYYFYSCTSFAAKISAPQA
jgi:chemotaxis protein histidine kinase CheA